MSKHQDREWLYDQYVEEELPPSKIAEKCDIHPDTVIYWRDKFGFPKVDHSKYGGQSYDQPYHDEEWLRREYWEKERTTVEMGEECGVAAETIRKWLEKYGLGTRERSEQTRLEWVGADERRRKQSEYMSERRSSIHPSIFTRKEGYEVVMCATEKTQIGLHRLLAISEYGFDEVMEKDVHHENGIPWDNRLENIDLVTASEHTKIHQPWKANEKPE